MKPTPELISLALAYLEADLASPPANRVLFTSNDQIPNKYKGYISSFGGSIVQMGVMPACMAFIANDDKKKIVDALFSIYCIKYGIAATGLKDHLTTNWQNWNTVGKKQFRNRISAIAVSFKLALRTFEIDESHND
ncbi:MAG: hypothetical protein IT266_02210 [Saprospiraceae bacterium]|nr:hypothetical protein [Saprospiraceae bacterium]